MISTGLRLSSVVPATVTAEQNMVHELTDMDLAMKLHYIEGLYFFKSDAVEGLTIYDLKKPMFHLLQLQFTASGRIRRSETGRPFIKCNDSGVRIVEAYSEEAMDQWLAMAMEDSSRFDGLTYNQALGPDLGFSPLVFLQFTWFKCGGMSVGLSWANVLGDAFSASAFINMLGKIMAGHLPLKPLHVPVPGKPEFPAPSTPNTSSSLKRVDSVGDYWVTPNNCKMRKHTFHVSAKKLDHLLSNQSTKFSAFEVLSAIIWKSLSKIKENSAQTRRVTICTNSHEREYEIPSNNMVLSTVEADFLVTEADVSELVELILNRRAEEKGIVEEMKGLESGSSDFIAYGANLAFVNLEEAEIYGLELKGQKPVYANYCINGVGDEGVVLVLPGPNYGKEEANIRGGRLVTVVLPENEVAQLKTELQREWSTA
ncbi:PREDICTED: protein ECERIFERUM 1 [Prunus mume]|uniref:Protein ECERIFERUM 1 n=1 Tax=Prunus mume TaxID=102107 RepID=A0ABM0N431_PRUMU|nr:PREDICTED: protein ECERIFERUM 1 [Prunus mume]